MDDDEEQPIAVAITGGGYELVFEQDIFWGTIINETQATTQFLEQRNLRRIDALLLEVLPFSLDLVVRIAGFVHHHF
jgi:hypothetical protein